MSSLIRESFSRPVAALIAIVVTIATGSLFVRDTRAVQYYSTRVGEQKPLPLKDGSVITLNTDTQINLRRDGSTLYVRLFKGEVHFNMLPNPGRTLIVSVGDRLEIIDTATIFDVRLTETGEAGIIVQEGRVELSAADLAHVELLQNQQAKVTSGPTQLAIRTQNENPHEIERQLSWLHGYLDFRCETLANAAGEFNRYNLTHIELMDEPTKKLQIGGMFSTLDPMNFAQALVEVSKPNIQLDKARTAQGTLVLRLSQATLPRGSRARPMRCTPAS
jgi:transmembrane sensor